MGTGESPRGNDKIDRWKMLSCLLWRIKAGNQTFQTIIAKPRRDFATAINGSHVRQTGTRQSIITSARDAPEDCRTTRKPVQPVRSNLPNEKKIRVVFDVATEYAKQSLNKKLVQSSQLNPELVRWCSAERRR